MRGVRNSPCISVSLSYPGVLSHLGQDTCWIIVSLTITEKFV
ncbi:unnamed protein product [Brassica rapa subsp. trilocularis]